MAKINWYNFTSKQWSDWQTVLVGFEEDWKNDKTFDGANLSIKTDDKPNIEIGDFVNLTENEDLQYTAEMLPANHSQYVVYFVKKRKNKNNWITELELIEPTQYLKGMQSQGLSFTNQIEKEVVVGGNTVTYRKDRYNVLSAVERVLKVGKTNTDNFDGVRIDGTSHFNRIKVLDKTELAKVDFNDKSFNSADLYTIFSEIGDTINKTPVLYFDLLKDGEYKAIKTETIQNYNLTVGVPSELYKSYYIDNGEFKGQDGVLDQQTNFIARGQVWYEIDNNELFKIKVINYIVSGNNVTINGYAEKYTLTELTKIELANDYKPAFLLKFERLDGFDKDIINYETLIEGNIGLEEEQTFENYATKISTNAINITSKNSIELPVQNIYISPQQDLKGEREVQVGTGAKGLWFLETPFKIKKVLKVEKVLFKGRYSSGAFGFVITTFKVQPIDINDKYLLEKRQYEASDLIENEKDKIVWFEEGTNRIYVNEYWTQNDGNSAIEEVYMYYVSYEPLIDSVLSAGSSGKYELLINQTNSQVNSLDYSIFLSKYLDSMNRADITVMQKYSSRDEIFELGARVKKDNDYYLITNIGIKNANTKLIVVYQLNKEYQRRNINVLASEEILKNIAIGYDNLKERFRELIDEVEIYTKSSNYKASKILTDKRILLSALIPNEIHSALTPQLAVVENISKVNIDNTDKTETIKNLFYLAKMITVNGINIILTSIDNALLGTKKIARVINNIEAQFAGVRKQIPILFTNPFGENDKTTISFTSLNNTPLEAVDINTIGDSDMGWADAKAKFLNAWQIFYGMNELPDIVTHEEELRTNEIFRTETINEFKDMLENYNQTISFRIKSNNDILVHNKIYELSRLNKSTDTHTLKIKGYSKNKSYFDNLTDDLMFNENATSQVFGNAQSGIIVLAFASQGNINDLKSVIITTDSDERLLTFNNAENKIIELEDGQFAIYY